MYRLLFSCTLLWTSIPANSSASIDSLLFLSANKKASLCDSCETIGLNAREKIMGYFQSDQMDSLNVIFECWHYLCGKGKVDSRLDILYSIANKTFNETNIDSLMFRNIIIYRDFYLSWTRYNVDYYYQNDKLYDDFSEFIRQYANRLIPGLDTTSIEFLYALFYAGNFEQFFKEIEKKPFSKSRIARLYEKEIRRVRLFPSPRAGFSGGIWHPSGNVAILGNQPEVGFFMGIRWLRFSLDFNINRRIFPSKNEYLIVNEGIADTTTGHNVYHFGLDFMVHALKLGRHEIDVSAGFGWESLQIKEIDLFTFPCIPGVGYRVYLGKDESMYIGAQLRYYYLNFNNVGGTPLNGNALSFKLMYGFSDYFFKTSNLKALGREK
jgi:hypothetical protein